MFSWKHRGAPSITVKIRFQALVSWAFLNNRNYSANLISEINFWNNRLKNLTCVSIDENWTITSELFSTFSYIYEQLRHERIKSMALILEHTDSAYFPCFKTMFKNVVTALAESRDITLYLSPLMKHFLQFEETDFSESKPLLKPLMHVVSLVSDSE